MFYLSLLYRYYKIVIIFIICCISFLPLCILRRKHIIMKNITMKQYRPHSVHNTLLNTPTFINYNDILSLLYKKRNSIQQPSSSSSSSSSSMNDNITTRRDTRKRRRHRRKLTEIKAATTTFKDDTTINDDNVCSNNNDDSIQWNGYCAQYHNNNNDNNDNLLYSWLHCIGDDHYMHRSCQFHNMCIDITLNEYYLLPSLEEINVIQSYETLMKKQNNNINNINNYDYIRFNSVSYKDRKVALTSMNKTDELNHNVNKDLLWFPKIITSVEQYNELFKNGYYLLPESVVVIPTVQSIFDNNTNNIIHIIWKELYSIFILLRMFDMDNTNHYKRLFVSIDQFNIPLQLSTFLYPFFGISNINHKNKDNNNNNVVNRKSNIICIPNSVAGVGIISDMNHNNNNSKPSSSSSSSSFASYMTDDTYTLHRGANMLDFRNSLRKSLMRHHQQEQQDQPEQQRTELLLDGDDSKLDLQLPIQITISLPSKPFKIDNHFINRYQFLMNELYHLLLYNDNNNRYEENIIRVEYIQHRDMEELNEHSLLISKSHAHITLLGYDDGISLVLSTLLPIGSSLIIFEDNTKEKHNDKDNNDEYDYERQVLNSIGYFRLKWIPLLSSSSSTMNDENENIIELVVNHIQNGLDMLVLQE